MPAYVIFLRETPVSDPQAFAEYKVRAQAAARDVTPKKLTGSAPPDTLEGTPPDGAAVLEFRTMEEARAWYFSALYQDAAAFRQKAATCRAILLQGAD